MRESVPSKRDLGIGYREFHKKDAVIASSTETRWIEGQYATQAPFSFHIALSRREVNEQGMFRIMPRTPGQLLRRASALIER